MRITEQRCFAFTLGLTYDTSILCMAAIVVEKSVVQTLLQIILAPFAPHVIQDNRSAPLTVSSAPWRQLYTRVPQHAADDLGIVHIPVVVADRAPDAVVVDLDATRARVGAVGEAYLQRILGWYSCDWSFGNKF